jgi:glutathione S-transferase
MASVPGAPVATLVAGGLDHSLALAGDGRVWAWGGNDNGQLGDDTARASATLEPALGEMFMAKRRGESGESQAAAIVPMVAFAERALADRPWLTGEAFSAADVILASSFQWLRAMAPDMVPAWLSAFSTRAFALPAALRAIAI